MSNIVKINGIPIANIKKINGIPIANIKKVNGCTIYSAPADALSLDPTYINFFSFGGSNYTEVTSSGTWTAAVVNSAGGIITGCTSSGGDGDRCWVYCDENPNEFAELGTVEVVCGTIHRDLDICIDGTIYTCIDGYYV